MSLINREALSHLAELARIELDAKEEERFLRDLAKILDYFSELKELNTDGIAPMSGGTSLTNIFRRENVSESTNQGKGKSSFPKEHKGFLKVPPVFENNA